MKKVIAILLTVLFVFMCCACGKDQPAEPTQNDTTAAPVADVTETPTADEPEETDAPETEPASTDGHVAIDENTITVSDDGTGEPVDEEGMKKTPVVTTRGINYETMLGPVLFKINSIQISVISANNETYASYVGIETGKEYTLISIDMTVENTSDEDVYFYPDQSTVITDHKEQITANLLASDSVGGDFYGNVEKTGQVFFIAEKTPANELASFNLRIDGPSGSSHSRLTDDITIKFNIQK